jgi:Caspase domain/Domain of unknown function (DUF4189)/Putative peptidoglycan binding domain
MRAFALFFACVLLGAAFGVCRANASQRLALVIGNSRYQHAPALKNPTNDAQDISAALQRLGFETVLGVDLDHGKLLEKIRAFTEGLAGAEVALFYYAGHGVQVRGKNYLAPIDARLEREADLDFTAVDLDLVLRNMQREPRTNIVFMDACRDNPLTVNLARNMGSRSASVGRGLATIEGGIGTLIAFATQPGNIALDGDSDSRNSPFTKALLGAIERPGLTISEVMIAVRNDVLKQTNNQQIPWDHSSLTGPFYFVPGGAALAAPVAAIPETNMSRKDAATLEFAFWDTVKSSSNMRLFEAYLKRYPDGAFSDIAKIRLDELAAKKPLEDNVPISDRFVLHELRDRLYELNFDPGAVDAPLGEETRQSIREYQATAQVEQTGEPTFGLLKRLRSTPGLRPWGAIVYAPGQDKWGMAWDKNSRKEAVASARESCGECKVEVSFFGTECGAFAYSNGIWSIVSRGTITQAKDAALSECRAKGKSCHVVAAACANGTQRVAGE